MNNKKAQVAKFALTLELAITPTKKVKTNA
jgi:hypothetical protein